MSEQLSLVFCVLIVCCYGHFLWVFLESECNAVFLVAIELMKCYEFVISFGGVKAREDIAKVILLSIANLAF